MARGRTAVAGGGADERRAAPELARINGSGSHDGVRR